MNEKTVSEQTLRRLPVYLHYLKSIRDSKTQISATAIAAAFGLNDVQVRKDLGSVSGSGKPRTGYVISELISEIEGFLGCGFNSQTVLIGAGNLGKALMSYSGFRDYGLTIVAAFDKNPAVTGHVVGGKPILRMEELEQYCTEHKIHLAILTLPSADAQNVCNRLVSCGIRAIWNFAPVILKVPDDVTVENENLASSLAILSRQISMDGENE